MHAVPFFMIGNRRGFSLVNFTLTLTFSNPIFRFTNVKFPIEAKVDDEPKVAS